MNLIEAMTSGLPFRRKQNVHWCTIPDYMIFPHGDGQGIATVKGEDLLADDWEVFEELTITYEQFYKCLDSQGLCPNTGKGVAVDVGAAWNILRRIVTDETT